MEDESKQELIKEFFLAEYSQVNGDIAAFMAFMVEVALKSSEELNILLCDYAQTQKQKLDEDLTSMKETMQNAETDLKQRSDKYADSANDLSDK